MRPLLMTASACGPQSLGEEKHIYDKTCIAASLLAQEMRPVCAQYARQFFEQICVSHHLPRPTCRAHRHVQVKRLDFENAKIVSNFLSRPVPFRPRRNVRKRGSLQSDVCARWVVSSHRCRCQGVVVVHCPGSRHELASLPCRPYMHFQRTHMWKPWRFSLHPGCSMELLRSETLVKASAAFTSFWSQNGPPGAETLVKA